LVFIETGATVSKTLSDFAAGGKLPNKKCAVIKRQVNFSRSYSGSRRKAVCFV
jgi:hypothetical protein